ncbi:hypothetical protein [Massilia glaciei]|uniref:hypothetical protein n=1 Tax=Massilia glaciei TaxID=1524097 RepID=UPI0015E81743|nr:hypothetical protein [Massilia glaciei]
MFGGAAAARAGLVRLATRRRPWPFFAFPHFISIFHFHLCGGINAKIALRFRQTRRFLCQSNMGCCLIAKENDGN